MLRGTEVTLLSTVPDARTTTARDINNREQMVLHSDSNTAVADYFVDGTRVEQLPGLAGGFNTMLAASMNDRGAVVGRAADGNFNYHAVLWQDGTLTDIGFVPGGKSTEAHDVNARLQVVGSGEVNGSTTAFVWQNGAFTILPEVSPGDTQSSTAASINDWGVIVGSSVTSSFQIIGTLWFNGQVVSIDSLVRVDDPLRAFVTVLSAIKINERGDIIANGEDWRTGQIGEYFLTLFDP